MYVCLCIGVCLYVGVHASVSIGGTYMCVYMWEDMYVCCVWKYMYVCLYVGLHVYMSGGYK